MGQLSQPPDDSAVLLAGLLARDGGAWRRLVDAYSPLLLAVARRTFAAYGHRPSPQDVEDAVAEVWANLLANDLRLVHQCAARGNLLQMLHVLTRNRSVDLMRKRRLRTVELVDGSAAAQGDSEEDSGIDIAPAELAAALGELSSRQRVVVDLFFLQGKKYREIAELTGIPQNSVGPTLSRAVAGLRQRLLAKQYA